jgi:hypothetical protein
LQAASAALRAGLYRYSLAEFMIFSSAALGAWISRTISKLVPFEAEELMDWKHFFLAVLVAGTAASFADWLFAGVLFHKKYVAYPEVWRPGLIEGRDAGPIAGATALGFVSVAAFLVACGKFEIHGYGATLGFACLAWLMVPVPLTITNALFMKIHPLIVVSHSLGWLAKLAIAAVVAGWLIV